jgi:Tfp pilus assembly protein PilF
MNDTLSGAYTARAMVHLFHDQDWAAAQRDFAKAIQYDSTQYEPWLFRTWAYIATDSLAQAVSSMRHAKLLAPLEAIVGVRLATTLRYSGRVGAADSELTEVLARDPSNGTALAEQFELRIYTHRCEANQEYLRSMRQGPNPLNRALAAFDQARCGDRPSAERFADSLAAESEKGYVDMFALALSYAGLGDSAKMYHALDQAAAQHNWALFYLGAHFAFEPYHGEARFEALKAKVGVQ